MIIDGTKYFKLAYIKALTRDDMSMLRRQLKYYATVNRDGHKFNEKDLNYIEAKLNRRLK
tara:strand:- start:187 stop:366 length:180 start_codon:yes stop_codon:yes gene_type:complete